MAQPEGLHLLYTAENASEPTGFTRALLWAAMKSADSSPVREFLRRLDNGELAEGFIQELRKLSPQHRREVCEALVRRSEEFLLSTSAQRPRRREILTSAR